MPQSTSFITAHGAIRLVLCQQDLSYQLSVLSLVGFGLEGALLHGFSHKILLQLRPLRL